MKLIYITFLSAISLGCATAAKEYKNTYTSVNQMFERVAPKMCRPNVGCFSPMNMEKDDVAESYRNDTRKCEENVYSEGVKINGILTTDDLRIEEFKKKYRNITINKIAYSHEAELSSYEAEELQAYQELRKEVTKCLAGIGWNWSAE